MWKRIKVLELNITTHVDFGGLEEFCTKNVKTKMRIFLVLSAGFQSKHFGFLAAQAVIFNANEQL